ncbi:hypothetical protein JCM31826_13070 [Thermaurantimonas aggregans]|uniref:DUF4292 domain-containing protein n=1 Tax=Thermaurantimonas aggregans TaxID=2173829 RepID=A0A401XLA9_9FLAO|nr:DUF4292 domain-containing protein [Thermaurantimonas aggregans]MCX8148320.1 DUF4292 domain-containing protein [Thermaurantimonas aggregans]GCD77825.1 hypothetical protein JCM31826_13070 [Thermaurantimonas aggregans]
MKYFISAILALSLVVGCKSKRTVVTTPSAPSEPSIAESILSRITSQPYLTLRGKGQYQDNSSTQSFRYEIRIQNEDRLLVEMSDPLLGLRIARLYADRDTIVFINRAQRQYAAGGRTTLHQIVGLEVETDDLIRLLKALPVRWNAPWEGMQREPDMIHLYSIIPINAFDKVTGELHITGFDFKIRKQILSNIPYRLTAEYEYAGEDPFAPKQIALHLTANGNFLKLQLVNDRLQTDSFDIKIPEVPNGYAPVSF